MKKRTPKLPKVTIDDIIASGTEKSPIGNLAEFIADQKAKPTHFCLCKMGINLGQAGMQYLPLDRATAKLTLGWLRRTSQPYQVRRRITAFGRPAVDIVLITETPEEKKAKRVATRVSRALNSCKKMIAARNNRPAACDSTVKCEHGCASPFPWQRKDRKWVVDEVCDCGHLRSEHTDTLAWGHGGCKGCSCAKFTWKQTVTQKQLSTRDSMERTALERRAE